MKTVTVLAATLLFMPLAHADYTPAGVNPTDVFRNKIDSFNFFIGNWSCADSSASSDTNRLMGNHEDAASINTVVERGVGDSWLVFHWDAKGADTSNDFASGVSYISYDSMRNMFVDFTFAPRGGYASFSSAGWESLNAMQWAGSAQNYQGQTVAQRKTLTVLERDLFSMTYETSSNGTAYDVFSRKICHRR